MARIVQVIRVGDAATGNWVEAAIEEGLWDAGIVAHTVGVLSLECDFTGVEVHDRIWSCHKSVR